MTATNNQPTVPGGSVAGSQFDALQYFKLLAKKNKLCQAQGFKPVYISGIEGLEGALAEYRKTANFVMIDDTTSQVTYSKGVTFFDKNVYTVCIVAHYKHGDMEDREEKLRLCRRIFRQFHSRLIKDKAEYRYGDMLDFLDVESIYSRELNKDWLSGVTGLYFMVNNDEPTDLSYNQEDWDE